MHEGAVVFSPDSILSVLSIFSVNNYKIFPATVGTVCWQMDECLDHRIGEETLNGTNSVKFEKGKYVDRLEQSGHGNSKWWKSVMGKFGTSRGRKFIAWLREQNPCCGKERGANVYTAFIMRGRSKQKEVIWRKE